MYHLFELRTRLIFYFGSWLSSCLIYFYYMPQFFLNSPYLFFNFKWDDALWDFFLLAALLAFATSFPILIFHFYCFVLPGLFPNEARVFSYFLVYFTIVCSLYWAVAPKLVFYFPSLFLNFHGDTIHLSPLLDDFVWAVFDYFYCSLLIFVFPLLILFKVSRLFLFLVAFAIAAILGDAFFLFPLLCFIEVSWWFIFFLKVCNFKPVAQW